MESSRLLTSRKSPLKWAGGKKRIVEKIKANLPSSGKKRLIEPFVGGGSVFLNLDFEEYLLIDTNKDLINLFNIIKNDSERFIKEAEGFFIGNYNESCHYYDIRYQFNESNDPYEKSLFFVYLNRHGYNGLCRYNQKGSFNVPFGRYKHPYFPKNEFLEFAKVAQKATFFCGDFTQAFDKANENDVVYCDPPYSPINLTSNFTAYAGKSFTDDDQRRLVVCAEAVKCQRISTLISNRYTDFTKVLYKNADKVSLLSVQRNISCKGSVRGKSKEVMALYSG
ncbi:Dam family site-specific DNA-(adenine-N6)-methyltransferase [Candidatus Enterovibrio altilux]|uniref:Site-specific DNA-methyltransferase (adenine-specific) n=1 Tax=Candidatus Enterovibrio altilux TaxID=1927128 RepID=A0A291B961_9GAMM|nr:Dam family site-specific DNA-(adenine-N6)-methyltransferase [Candidatus Enterovibrio luxaltus]ATF09534.1 Methyl-directed repair DNA adenine methylase [Candidatus Enterovibrio luxaltus]